MHSVSDGYTTESVYNRFCMHGLVWEMVCKAFFRCLCLPLCVCMCVCVCVCVQQLCLCTPPATHGDAVSPHGPPQQTGRGIPEEFLCKCSTSCLQVLKNKWHVIFQH